MPQIPDGKDLDLGPSNPNQRDPNRMQQIDLVIYPRTSTMKVGKKRQ